MIRAVTWALALLLCSGCGPSYIVLEISANLSVPTDANSLHVITVDPNDDSREFANVDFLLTVDDEFPLEILLEPADTTPSVVQQRVTARLDGLPVARSIVEHPWEPHHASYAAFTLDPVP